MAGTLYIVATPIGNLDDMPPRVAATFGAADFIAAEDTRVTMKLLNFLGLKKPMVSYYEHALQKGEGILRRIEAGENCALCSDAGMPCVSDPGEVIVRDALARGIRVVPVPAASACVTALAVSGQDTSRWVFEGFLPVNKKQKRERLAELQGEKRTVIFYEAPHKLRTTLEDHPRRGTGPLRRERAARRIRSGHGRSPCCRGRREPDAGTGRTAGTGTDRGGLRPHGCRQGRRAGHPLLQERSLQTDAGVAGRRNGRINFEEDLVP